MDRSELVAGQTYYDNYCGQEVTLVASFDPDHEGDDIVVRREGNICAFTRSSRLSLPPLTRGVYRSPRLGSLLYVFCPVPGRPDSYHTTVEYSSGSTSQIKTAKNIRSTWEERVGDLPEYPSDRGSC